MHPADADGEQLLKSCRLQHTRRQGPGGQHRNKVETAVVLQHLPTGVTAEANEKRSQADNKSEAIFRMRLALAVEVRTCREATISPLLAQRIKAKKLAVNPRHRDFPGLLAEILDRIAEHDYQVPDAAQEIGISGSQLIKFLKLHPPAFEQFNLRRQERDLPRLKF